MRIGLCAWSFTGSHREAKRDIDPHSPLGLIRLAQNKNLASVEFASGSLRNYNKQEIITLQSELKSLDLFLLTAAGALFVGTVCAKQILPLSVSATKLSQFLYFPVDLGVLAKALKENVKRINIIKNFLTTIIRFYTKLI